MEDVLQVLWDKVHAKTLNHSWSVVFFFFYTRSCFIFLPWIQLPILVFLKVSLVVFWEAFVLRIKCTVGTDQCSAEAAHDLDNGWQHNWVPLERSPVPGRALEPNNRLLSLSSSSGTWGWCSQSLAAFWFCFSSWQPSVLPGNSPLYLW